MTQSPNIFVSSVCSRQNKIGPAVYELAEAGFRHIELTGGTLYYEGYEEDLLSLKKKYNLTYLIHNYFPPPEKDFVINLASTANDIYRKSLQQLIKAIRLSRKIGAKRFGFHAGFLIDFAPSLLGKGIDKSKLINKEDAIERFCEGFNALTQEAQDISLYIENNVYSNANYKIYKDTPPFLLLTSQDYSELKTVIDFNLLLDLAHLKVTARSLHLHFEKELTKMIDCSDYIHISGNIYIPALMTGV